VRFSFGYEELVVVEQTCQEIVRDDNVAVKHRNSTQAITQRNSPVYLSLILMNNWGTGKE
jgi:hypothetical protein